MRLPLLHTVLASLAVVALSGCTVGPNFHAPKPPATHTYTSSPLPSQTVSAPTSGGKSQRFVLAQKISAQWWKLFQSPKLNALIRQGLANSPTLAAAKAALRQARENLSAESGALLYPGVDANLRATRQRASGASFGGSSLQYNLFNADVQVSYLLDLFGSTRRQLEGLRATVDYQRYQFEGAYLTLAANIATTAINEASLRGQIQATQEILAAERKLLRVVKQQFELGAVSKTSVLSQQSQLAITTATLPPLEKQLSYARHALAVLVGKLPSTADMPQFKLSSLQLPAVLPVSLPSELVRQRPDIRASQALLHQASAQIGVATANLYPQITLTGSYGFESAKTETLFNGQNVVWNLGAGLLQPVFHGGELRAKRRAAVAAFDQAAAQYRETVLTAFQNVADVLRALETDARALKAEAQAEAASRATLNLTRQQFELGAVSYQSLLTAQRDYQQTRINLITAEANRYADSAALFQALGGGWWNGRAPDQKPVTRPAAQQTAP